VHRLRLLGPWLWGLRLLPPRVAIFQARALLLALRLRDDFALASVSRPRDVRLLLDLARGRDAVVELGTATGWTAASLAMAEPGRRVVSFDPVVTENRHRYLALVPPDARARIDLRTGVGARGDAPWPVELLFIDSTHERADTVAEFEAWRPRLAPGGLVAFHDHGNPAFPGVAEAVHDLGLSGESRDGVFVWRA
jgi:predicted O-methyltransferase YrrM